MKPNIQEIVKKNVLKPKIEGWLMPGEAYRLAELSIDRVVLELGSYKGRSTVTMAPFAEHIHCVDHFCPKFQGQGYDPSSSTLEEFLANTKPWADKISYYKVTTQEAFKMSWPSIGLLFIDANHTPEDVAHDIRFIKLLGPEGVVALHDTEKPGVAEALAASVLIRNWRELKGVQTLRAFTKEKK